MADTGIKTGSSRITQVYAYIVSFAALLVFAIMTILGIVGIVKIAVPEYTISKYEYQSMQRSEIVVEDIAEPNEPAEAAATPADSVVMDTLPQVEPKKAAPIDIGGIVSVTTPESILDGQRHEGVSELIHMFAAWIVCIPIFWFHFRWAGRLAAKEARPVRSSNPRYPRRRPTRQQQPPKSS